jgi:hypothetical protein
MLALRKAMLRHPKYIAADDADALNKESVEALVSVAILVLDRMYDDRRDDETRPDQQE